MASCRVSLQEVPESLKPYKTSITHDLTSSFHRITKLSKIVRKPVVFTWISALWIAKLAVFALRIAVLSAVVTLPTNSDTSGAGPMVGVAVESPFRNAETIHPS